MPEEYVRYGSVRDTRKDPGKRRSDSTCTAAKISIMQYVDAFKQSHRDSRRRSYVTIHSVQGEKKYHMGHEGGERAGRLVPEAKG